MSDHHQDDPSPPSSDSPPEEAPQASNRPSVEDIFVRRDDDEAFDAELEALTKTRNRGSVLRPILMIIIVLLVTSVITDWSDEVRYFFHASEPVELGDASEFPIKQAEDPEWTPDLEHNSYVSIQGMPTRISSGDRYEVFRLVGADIYVQRELEAGEDDDREEGHTLPRRNMGPGLQVDEHRDHYRGQGRLLAFEDAPGRVSGLKEFFGQTYNTQVCEDFSDRRITDMEERRAEIFRQNWYQRYQEASDDERQEKGLTPEPTDDDVQRALDRNPVCTTAYLLHDDQSPEDHWWYVALSALLGLFVIFNIVKLVRWFKQWLKP